MLYYGIILPLGIHGYHGPPSCVVCSVSGEMLHWVNIYRLPTYNRELGKLCLCYIGVVGKVDKVVTSRLMTSQLPTLVLVVQVVVPQDHFHMFGGVGAIAARVRAGDVGGPRTDLRIMFKVRNKIYLTFCHFGWFKEKTRLCKSSEYL